MKFAGKHKKRAGEEPIAPEPEDSFYSQQSEETLYDAGGSGSHRMRRATSNSPVRRRESNNRAADRQLLFIVLKIILIPVLLFVGYLGLKFLVGFLEKPSEERQEQWAQDAERMDSPVEDGASRSAGGGQVDKELLEDRVSRWESAERHLRAGASLEQREIDEEAAGRLKQALQYAPDHREALLLLLDVYIRSGSYAEAVPVCMRLLDQVGNDWDVKMKLLKALQETERMDAGLYLATQMMAQEPTRVDIMEMTAYAHAALGETKEALEVYNRILERDKGHLLALEGVGYIHQWLQEWPEAIPYYMELVRLEPRPEYYRALARCYSHQEEAGKATIFLSQAASLYGGGQVGQWLRDPDFDLIRETVDFRALSDRVVGVEARKAIEAICRREATKRAPALSREFDLPRPDLQILRPRDR